MKAETVIKRAQHQREQGEKADLLRGLSALLVITPVERTKARKCIQDAIAYIEKN